jgi:hypothetical protein
MSQRYANWKLAWKVIGTTPEYHFPLYSSQSVLARTRLAIRVSLRARLSHLFLLATPEPAIIKGMALRTRTLYSHIHRVTYPVVNSPTTFEITTTSKLSRLRCSNCYYISYLTRDESRKCLRCSSIELRDFPS